MNKDKFIWEVLGHHWHDYEWVPYGNAFPWQCSCGHHTYSPNDWTDNPDFTTDAGKVLLFREMMGREDWAEFLSIIGTKIRITEPCTLVDIDFITDTTGKFKDAVFDYLKEKAK